MPSLPRKRRRIGLRCGAFLNEGMETIYAEEEDYSDVWTMPASYGRASAGRRRGG
jgi:hypothetical protein